MQNRRNFLKQASLMLAGGLVAPQLLSSCGGKSGQAAATASESSKYIGLQLYSLRDLVKEEGIQKVLETAAKMGYKNLETASYDNGKIYGLAPAEFKKMVNDLGMKCTSAHLGQAFTKEKEAEVMSWWDQAIDAHNELGVKYMVQPWMPVNDKTTLDDLKMYCDYFNTVGYKTAAASIAFGYHNHDFEFRKIDDQLIYDFLLDNVSPNHVFFEMDVYWVMMGGGDPVAYLKNRPSWWDQAIDAHNELGVKYMVQPWMPVNDKTTLDDLKMYCDYFNTVGYKTAAASIAFGYHNHDFEFRKIDDQLIYDFLLDNVSPNHVFFEMDVYWVMMGGGDPVAYLKNRPSQFKAIHIKDEKEIGASGKMNFKPIFDQMYANNVKDWYVEVEQYTNNDPVASVQQSYDFLNKADYVK